MRDFLGMIVLVFIGTIIGRLAIDLVKELWQRRRTPFVFVCRHPGCRFTMRSSSKWAMNEIRKNHQRYHNSQNNLREI